MSNRDKEISKKAAKISFTILYVFHLFLAAIFSNLAVKNLLQDDTIMAGLMLVAVIGNIIVIRGLISSYYNEIENINKEEDEE